jgi:hypothetical protein
MSLMLAEPFPMELHERRLFVLVGDRLSTLIDRLYLVILVLLSRYKHTKLCIGGQSFGFYLCFLGFEAQAPVIKALYG